MNNSAQFIEVLLPRVLDFMNVLLAGMKKLILRDKSCLNLKSSKDYMPSFREEIQAKSHPLYTVYHLRGLSNGKRLLQIDQEIHLSRLIIEE